MAGEFNWGGLGGGPGGIAFPDILSALGQALLSSPRDAPFANLPTTMQAATQAGRQRQSDAAMVAALKQAGYDDSTALQLAANPEAAKLAVQARTLKENTDLLSNDPILGGTGNMGLGGKPVVPAATAGPRADAGPRLPTFAGGGADASRPMSMPVDPALVPAVIKHSQEAGLDPAHVLTAMSYETGGTLDPWKAGPTTKWGQHRGLIQWGQPQARQYGVGPDTPVDDQVKAAVQYLKDRGVQPGMGLMDIYSAINAGGVGRYGASDAAAGGAPGTVADKVNNQMAGHVAKAQALLAPYMSKGGAPAPEAGASPGWQTAQASPDQFDAQLQQARGGTAASGAKVPIVAPIPRTEENTQALAGIKQAGYQPPTNTQEAYQQAVGVARRIQLYEARGMKVEGLKPILDHYLKLATPTDLERQLDAANVQGEERRQALLNAIPNHQPTAIREAEYVTQRPAMRDTVIEMKRAGAPNTVINNAVNPILKGLGEQFVTGADAARASADTIRSVQTARAQIDAPGGVVTGQWANNRLALQKIGSLFGAVNPETIQNTETFRAAIKPVVLETVKGLGAGSGISNADREFAEKAVGGDIALDEGAIRRVLDITERAARSKIDRHNTLADKMLQTQPDLQAIAPMLRIEAPPPAGGAPSPSGAPPLSGTTKSGVPWSARP